MPPAFLQHHLIQNVCNVNIALHTNLLASVFSVKPGQHRIPWAFSPPVALIRRLLKIAHLTNAISATHFDSSTEGCGLHMIFSI